MCDAHADEKKYDDGDEDVRSSPAITTRQDEETAEEHTARLSSLIETMVRQRCEADAVQATATQKAHVPQWRQTFLLVLALLAINVVFAFAFSAIELRRELREARDVRQEIFERLPSITDSPTCTLPAFDRKFIFDRVAKSHTVSYECGQSVRAKQLERRFKKGRAGLEELKPRLRANAQICDDWDCLRMCRWRWHSSFYFVMTVFTTIGYGNFAPVHTASKLLVVVLLFLGGWIAIPLYGHLGRDAAHLLKRVPVFREHLLPTMCGVAVGYIALGGVLFSYSERNHCCFSFWNAVYFCIQTLSTLGLGDVTLSPGIDDLAVAWIYTIFGFGLLGTALSTIGASQQEYRDRVATKIIESIDVIDPSEFMLRIAHSSCDISKNLSLPDLASSSPHGQASPSPSPSIVLHSSPSLRGGRDAPLQTDMLTVNFSI